MVMLEFINTFPDDLHPILIHYPIALIGFSFLLSILSFWFSTLNQTSWLLLWVGSLSCIPASVSGLISQFPYEETELLKVIEIHQMLGVLGTLSMLLIVGSRFWSRCRQKDFGLSHGYRVLAAVGLIWVTLLGGTGGQLTCEYAVNVRGINPLLNESANR